MPADPTAEIIGLWSSEQAPDFAYFASAEESTDTFWLEGAEFRKQFDQLELAKVLEIACGAGRHSERAAPLCGELVIVDTSAAALELAAARLRDQSHVRTVLSPDGVSVPLGEDGTFSAAYSYDAMVHFEPLCIASYLGELTRLLRPDGLALLHHSNYDAQPAARALDNPGWRNFMNSALFEHLASRAGLEIVSRQTFDWVAPQSDALSLLRKPPVAP
jgi:cyclopropane fatty-acyl-phospholipid synthase-like methyltransferase